MEREREMKIASVICMLVSIIAMIAWSNVEDEIKKRNFLLIAIEMILAAIYFALMDIVMKVG